MLQDHLALFSPKIDGNDLISFEEQQSVQSEQSSCRQSLKNVVQIPFSKLIKIYFNNQKSLEKH